MTDQELRLKALELAKERAPTATSAELISEADVIYQFLSPPFNYDTVDMEQLACVLDKSYETLRTANAFLWSLNLNTQEKMQLVLSSKSLLSHPPEYMCN